MRTHLTSPLSAVVLAAAALVASPSGASAAPDPDRVPLLFETSFAHEGVGDYERALNDALEIVRLAPDLYLAQLRAAWLYYLRGRYDDAIVRYQHATRLAPKAIEPELGLMLPLMAAARWTEAEAIATRVLARAPRNYYASSRLAFIWFSLGRYPEAEAQYREVLEDFPSDTEMLLGLGWTLSRQGRTAEARRAFEQVLRVRRNHVSARAGLDALQ